MATSTLVIDNGAFSVKASIIPEQLRKDFAKPNVPIDPVVLPNCTAKSRAEKKFFVADGVNTAVDLSALYIRRPHDRGYVVNWDLEQDVWERMCHRDVLGIKPSETNVLVSETILTPSEIRDNLEEFVFETMGFQGFCSASSPLLAYNDHKHWDPASVLSRTGCGILVDSGFSFTHVIPMFEGRVLHKACRRIDIGGKLMTNLLKETLSYRQWNLMDETILINCVKERLSFVSLDYDADLATCKMKGRNNTVRRQYLLPTGIEGEDPLGEVIDPYAAAPEAKRVRIDPPDSPQKHAKGAHIRQDDECILELGNERFSVPEVLFHPDIIGMQQAGVSGAIQSAIGLLDPQLHPLLYSTVVCVGGNSHIPNFRQRVSGEVRRIAPSDFEVECPTPPQRSDQCVWRGGARLAASGKIDHVWVTKQEYEEKGHALCRQKLKEVDDIFSQKGKKSDKSKGKS